MEMYATVLVLISLVSGAISIVNIVFPSKAMGFANRRRAAHLFVLSFLLFVTGVIAGISALNNLKNNAPWIWVLSLVIAYGLFQFVRSGRNKRQKELVHGPNSSDSDRNSEVRIPPLNEQGMQTPSVVSTEDTVMDGLDKLKKSEARWIPPGKIAVVAGRNICGMIYLGSQKPHIANWMREGNSFINPSLPVARIGVDVSGDSLPYWPSYSDLNPQTRATYLNWLAEGKTDKRIGPGYVFLYFYGLERRFFVDTPTNEERCLIIFETTRLLDMYGENRSVQRYLETFLDVAHILVSPVSEAEPQFEKIGYELPLRLRVAIGSMVKAGEPLNSDWLLSWCLAHPETVLRTPVKRAFPEFKALFKVLFDRRYPDGLKIHVPKRILHARYTAASLAFTVDLNRFIGEIPDISGLSKPLNTAKILVEEATNALDKYSRFLGRNPEGRNSVEAHALLPECLWPLFPCAEMEDLRRWATGIIESGGLSPVEHVIERLEGVWPEKIGKRQLTGIADSLARLSIGMAPDPRFALRSPKLGEPVVLFRLPVGITALEEVSEKYRSILVEIAMGSFIAHADGTIAIDERKTLEARIDEAELPESERARLLANLQWMLAIPPDLHLLRRRLKDVPESARHELGQTALVMASVDGAIDPKEVRAIERLYKAIGLTMDGVYTDLHTLGAQSEPITVRVTEKQARDFAIPPPPERDGKVVLDPERVASLMADTKRVSSVLSDIFRDDEVEEGPEETQDEALHGFPGLDMQHAAFLDELLTRPHWKETEFSALADQFRLMQAGALETLNEWTFERYEDTLIEEYEGYELNSDVVAKLKH